MDIQKTKAVFLTQDETELATKAVVQSLPYNGQLYQKLRQSDEGTTVLTYVDIVALMSLLDSLSARTTPCGYALYRKLSGAAYALALNR